MPPTEPTKRPRGRPPLSDAGPRYVVQLSLPPELHDALRALADEQDRPVARLLRELLLAGLEDRYPEAAAALAAPPSKSAKRPSRT